MSQTHEQLEDRARQRGFDSGVSQASSGYRNFSPLSGEWAGESMTEILGDLVDEWADITGTDPDEDAWDTLADNYEIGFEKGQLSVFGTDSPTV